MTGSGSCIGNAASYTITICEKGGVRTQKELSVANQRRAQAGQGPAPEAWGRSLRACRMDPADVLTFFTLACSAFESFSAFLASFSSCFAVN